jgi:hypothetical protein
VIQKNAVRYFMDVEDLSQILKMILADTSNLNTIINVAYNNPTQIPEVLGFFEKYMGIKAQVTYIDIGSVYLINNDFFNRLFFQYYGKHMPIDYTEYCIKKYIQLKNTENNKTLFLHHQQ